VPNANHDVPLSNYPPIRLDCKPLNRPAAYIVGSDNFAKRFPARLHAARGLLSLVRREGRLAAQLDAVRHGDALALSEIDRIGETEQDTIARREREGEFAEGPGVRVRKSAK